MSTLKMRPVARLRVGRARVSPGLVVAPALLFGFGLMTGCGGGGGKVNNPSPGTPATTSLVSGSVTDIDGSPVVGASVSVNGKTATSSQGGAYSLSNVTVPANQASLVTTVTATVTINGKALSGQNTVEVLNGEANTANVNIVVSDASNQGTISGTVRDAGNQALPNARVFIAPGPVAAEQWRAGLYQLQFVYGLHGYRRKLLHSETAARRHVYRARVLSRPFEPERAKSYAFQQQSGRGQLQSQRVQYQQFIAARAELRRVQFHLSRVPDPQPCERHERFQSGRNGRHQSVCDREAGFQAEPFRRREQTVEAQYDDTQYARRFAH